MVGQREPGRRDFGNGSPRAIPAGSQARQKSLNYRTQLLLRGRFLCRAIRDLSKRSNARSQKLDLLDDLRGEH
jgi:hypothetical protein